MNELCYDMQLAAKVRLTVAISVQIILSAVS